MKPPPIQELRFRLAYADCDPAQVVYYAAYYPWFERTSTEWWYSKGVLLDRMAESHGVAIVSRASGCEYLATTRVFDHLACRMYVGRLGETSVTFDFEMVRLDDQVTVARGFYTVVTIKPGAGPTPIPASLRELLRAGAQ
jgi:YbgC/YbaW family acyl-CoA thioester hydrolase